MSNSEELLDIFVKVSSFLSNESGCKNVVVSLDIDQKCISIRQSSKKHDSADANGDRVRDSRASSTSTSGHRSLPNRYSPPRSEIGHQKDANDIPIEHHPLGRASAFPQTQHLPQPHYDPLKRPISTSPSESNRFPGDLFSSEDPYTSTEGWDRVIEISPYKQLKLGVFIPVSATTEKVEREENKENELETANIKQEIAEELLAVKKVFLLTGWSVEEKVEIKAAIESLGGESLEANNFEYECSHLLVKQPMRNEKFLACVASGKWVLTKAYVDESLAAGCFLPEDDYEWGSPSNHDPNLSVLSDMARRLAGSAHKWRRILHKRRCLNPGGEHGAFIEEPEGRWKVLLIADKSKEAGLTRVLQAGGGEIISTALPFTDHIMHVPTHAFLEERRITENKDIILGLLKSLSVKVYKPEYIPAFLRGDDDLEDYSLYNASTKRTKPTCNIASSIF